MLIKYISVANGHNCDDRPYGMSCIQSSSFWFADGIGDTEESGPEASASNRTVPHDPTPITSTTINIHPHHSSPSNSHKLDRTVDGIQSRNDLCCIEWQHHNAVCVVACRKHNECWRIHLRRNQCRPGGSYRSGIIRRCIGCRWREPTRELRWDGEHTDFLLSVHFIARMQLIGQNKHLFQRPYEHNRYSTYAGVFLNLALHKSQVNPDFKSLSET